MDVHIGITHIMEVSMLLMIVISVFVGAAWGKRIGMRGGTVKDSTIAAIEKARTEANKELQQKIKEIKEQDGMHI